MAVTKKQRRPSSTGPMPSPQGCKPLDRWPTSALHPSLAVEARRIPLLPAPCSLIDPRSVQYQTGCSPWKRQQNQGILELPPYRRIVRCLAGPRAPVVAGRGRRQVQVQASADDPWRCKLNPGLRKTTRPRSLAPYQHPSWTSSHTPTAWTYLSPSTAHSPSSSIGHHLRPPSRRVGITRCAKNSYATATYRVGQDDLYLMLLVPFTRSTSQKDGGGGWWRLAPSPPFPSRFQCVLPRQRMAQGSH